MPGIRPFPFAGLGVGTDICSVSRVSRVLNRWGPDYKRGARVPPDVSEVAPTAYTRLHHLTRHLFTHRERQDFQARWSSRLQVLQEHSSRTDSIELESPGRQLAPIIQHLAGRWAAKEAVIKACHWRRLNMSEIEILTVPGTTRIYGVILDQVAHEGKHAKRSLNGITEYLDEEEQKWREPQGDEEPGITNAGLEVKVSISHDSQHATAVCIAIADDGVEGDVGGEAAARELMR